MQRRIFSDLLAYLPAKLLPALTPFITVPIFTHLFTPDQYGTYMLAFGVSEFLLAATCTGFAAGAVRFYTAYKREAELPAYFAALFTSVGMMIILAVGLSAVLLIACHSLIPSDLYALLWVAILTFAANAWFATLMHVVRAQERSRWYTALELLSRYGTVAISLVLVLSFSISVIGLLWGQFLALLIAIVPLMWLTTRSIAFRSAHLSRSDMKQMWVYALPLTVGNIAFWGLRLSDRYIIEFFRGSTEVGLYSVSYNIAARSVDMVVGLFLLVPGPIIMRVWEEEGRRAAEDALTAISRAFYLLVFPAVVGLGVTSVPLVRLLAEEAYFDGHRAIWLVACASMAFGLGQLGSFGLLLGKRTGVLARNQFLATGASLVLNLIVVPVLGFMGAALSACLSFALLAGLQTIGSAKVLTWRWPLRTLFNSLMASVAMGGIVGLLIKTMGGYDSAVRTGSLAMITLLAILAGMLIYAAMLWALGEVSLRRFLKLVSTDKSVAETLVSPK